MAARVIARLTGERVVIQDDGSKAAMPDIQIDYVDKLPGFDPPLSAAYPPSAEHVVPRDAPTSGH